VLPAALVERRDFSTLRVCPGSYVDEASRWRHTDLLYSVRLGDRDAFVYVLFEHQSTVDPLMAFRLLQYLCTFWESWLAEHEDDKRLPAVIPVVLHHSKTGWTAPRQMLDLVDLEPEVLDIVRPHVPAFELVLDDLSAQSDEALYGRAMTAYARLVLWSLRAARGGRLPQGTFAFWARVFRELGEAPNGREAFETIFRYLGDVLDEDQRYIIDAILSETSASWPRRPT